MLVNQDRNVIEESGDRVKPGNKAVPENKSIFLNKIRTAQ